jgi:hypothetical protein
MKDKKINIRKMKLDKNDILEYKEIRLDFLRNDGEDSFYTYEETKRWNIETFLNYYNNNFNSNLEYDFLAIVEDLDTNKFVGM